jgi:chromosome segregation ATPase
MHATNLKIKQLDAKKLQLEADITKIESSLDNNLSTIIQSLEHEIQTLEQDIKRYQYATKMHKEYQTLIQEYEVLQAKYQEHYIANQLVSIIEHTEYTLLEDTINLFNQCLSEVTASLLDEPITVKLELWKTSNKRTKPNIHLQISYKGIETNNYSSLSGGEATRLSLALMIAFWIVHPSPFLLIDESLSSINHQLRDQAIVTFKRFITVPVLIILHETSSEGLFDHVLQL